MYTHATPLQFSLMSTPCFYSPMLPTMSMNPEFAGLFAQSPQTPSSIYASSLANTPSTSFSSFNSSIDAGNFAIQWANYSPPLVHSNSSILTGAESSPSTDNSTSSTPEYHEDPTTTQKSMPGSRIPLVLLSDDVEYSKKAIGRKHRSDRLSKKSKKSKGIAKMHKNTKTRDQEPRRITLGTFEGRKVVLKLMGPRKTNQI